MQYSEDEGSSMQVLLVEDNPGDVRLTVEALKDAKVHLQLHVVHDGVAAMEYLAEHGSVGNQRRPDLVLLDLNLPKKDGRQVLQEIKGNPELATIPVVVLTTSASEADIQKSYMLHANCFISKPVDMDGFLTVVRSIDDFWLSVVRLPGKGGHER